MIYPEIRTAPKFSDETLEFDRQTIKAGSRYLLGVTANRVAAKALRSSGTRFATS